MIFSTLSSVVKLLPLLSCEFMALRPLESLRGCQFLLCAFGLLNLLFGFHEVPLVQVPSPWKGYRRKKIKFVKKTKTIFNMSIHTDKEMVFVYWVILIQSCFTKSSCISTIAHLCTQWKSKRVLKTCKK